jgi:predicted ATP-binding protein involved in virulence
MWVEKLTLENIKCFDNCEIVFGTANSRYKWVTLLGENGGGKSTALQALLLAGPEGATKLLNSPQGWLRDESNVGKISVKIHQDKKDPGKFGDKKVTKAFAYNYLITGSQAVEVSKKIFTEPTILEGELQVRHLSWLRENALLPKGKGWFAAGYGAFRRLTRKSGQIIVPSLQTPLRYTNFSTQFEEDEPLTSFEQWLVYLDYRISKNSEIGKIAAQQREIGIKAINKLLPESNSYEKIDDNGRIWFNVNGVSVMTLSLSDGYRSILALAGDLIWRLIEAFPESKDPLKEEGIVLIDELDIHLHPTWQRVIPSWLQSVFPNIQFIVATHSPLIAAGAGKDAVTYRVFKAENGNTAVEKIENVAFQDVDSILQSRAFGLISTYSPDAEIAMAAYLQLKNKPNRNTQEETKLKELQPLAATILSSPPQKQSKEDADLHQEVMDYVKKHLAS